jgi:Adenylate and Guanylate cyclase catalytic domain
MLSAAKADNIVSSLFPNAVKERLYNAGDQPDKSKQEETDKKAEEVLGIEQPKGEPSSSTPEVSPIADLYENTTIMFCDLVGFTAWSSGRTPSDVFFLLETVYGRFDKLAKQRGVFKVRDNARDIIIYLYSFCR